MRKRPTHEPGETSQDRRRQSWWRRRRVVQVGGGAPIVVQSMTMTDTADAPGTARQCVELAEAGSEMVRITVNLPEAAAAVPEIKQRMLDAGCTAPLIGDFHYNGHLLLTKFPGCAAGAGQVPHQPRERRHRPASRRAVLDDLQGGGRSRPARPDWRQRRLAEPGARRRQDAGEHGPRSRQVVGRDHQRVHGPVGGRVDGARDRERAAQGPDHHFLQDLASAGSHRGVPRPGAADRSAAAPGPDGSGDGDEGPRMVGVGDGRAAGRRGLATRYACR